ncbi:MAG: dihydrofolate reductase family protein, partial [Bacteroidota bacterium]|nr:dihydrofolate reductase family protein [Bacteroidota bacterium]
DWVFKTGDEESKAWSVRMIHEAGMIVMGRKSFETLAAYWPTASGPFAAPMNEIPKAVFTQKGFSGIPPSAEQPPSAASWINARIFDGDLAEGIRELKAGSGKPIVALGGAGFMRSLITTGLIDEYQLIVHPVTLGAGMPIFTDLALPMYLKLVNVKAFPGGALAITYQGAT